MERLSAHFTRTCLTILKRYQSPQVCAMLFQTSSLVVSRKSLEAATERQKLNDSDKPITCMFYFFASQMEKNIESADPDLVRRQKIPDRPTHKFENMLARIGIHASYSPLVSRFETYLVEIPDAPAASAGNLKEQRETVHDTVLMMKFRSKRGREDWIATKEWQAFMKRTESEDVFRRMPHVRCASSTRGLMDPIDILTA